MTARFGLVITDTSPLITLAMADELDLITRAGMDVRVPDAVYLEATRAGKAGADRILAWLAANPESVRVTMTSVGQDFIARLESNRSTRGMGEQAAFEVANGYVDQFPDQKALLIYEDSDVKNRRTVAGNNVVPIATTELLELLEQTRHIQSSDQILAQARVAGRMVTMRETNRMDSQERAMLRDQLERQHDDLDRDR